MGNYRKRYIAFAKLSVPWSGALAAAKLLLGLFSLSFFLCVNAFYSAAVGLAKFLAVRAYLKGKPDTKSRFAAYAAVGTVILAAGTIYVIYCLSFFLGDGGAVYTDIVGITVAAFTFGEILISLLGTIKMRKLHEPVLEALKRTNLAASLISLVLTQTALLSFAAEGDMSLYNGISGLIFGSLASLVGVSMILRRRYVLSGKYAAAVLKRAESYGRKRGIAVEAGGDPLRLPLTLRVRGGSEEELKTLALKLRVRIERL